MVIIGIKEWAFLVGVHCSTPFFAVDLLWRMLSWSSIHSFDHEFESDALDFMAYLFQIASC